jgi:hypothetical protein
VVLVESDFGSSDTVIFVFALDFLQPDSVFTIGSERATKRTFIKVGRITVKCLFFLSLVSSGGSY